MAFIKLQYFVPHTILVAINPISELARVTRFQLNPVLAVILPGLFWWQTAVESSPLPLMLRLHQATG